MRKSCNPKFLLGFLVPLLLFALPIFAQQEGASLAGQVADQQGGRITGAIVTAVGTGGAETTVTADGSGNFVFLGLKPGSYALRVSAPGFQTYENKSVGVTPNRRQLLAITLRLAPQTQEITVTADSALGIDSQNTASTLVLRGADLDLLPDGPGGLAAALRILAVGSTDPEGPQVFVDGFPGGRIPPKASIREIRINQNPFSTEYDQPGQGRVEILTKPGSDTFHADAYSHFNDAVMNSRNPFAPERPPFQSRFYGGNISGPIVAKRASFFADFERQDSDQNAVINATVLDSALNPTPFNLAVLTPQSSFNGGPRLDYQLGENHTLVARYIYNRSHSANSGVGEFSLLSRAYTTQSAQHTFRLSETGVLGKNLVNDLRFQYVRDVSEQLGNATTPVTRVPEAFIAGGSDVGASSHRQARWEIFDTAMSAAGTHTLRAGGQVRAVRISDRSPVNFSGTFIFAGRDAPELDAAGNIVSDASGQPVMISISTLENYRRTLLFQRMGLAPEEIRARGGGPSQFSIAGGNAQANVSQYEAGLFLQDDWKVWPNFTMSGGLRYETQTNIDSHLNFAPRIGLGWSPHQGSKFVFRGGFGIFYRRVSEGLTLDTIRYNGVHQQQYVVSDTRILDGFPSVPPLETLAAFAIPQSITELARTARAPYMMQSSWSVQRALPKNLSLSATYMQSRSLRLLRSRDINAPLPNSGLRPVVGTGEIFQYETSGISNQRQLVVNLVHRYSDNLSYYASYVLAKAESDTDGVGTFPADSYNLKAEYGRSSQDIRHTFYWGGWMKTLFNMEVNPIVVLRSGTPFNITTGLDSNGDSLFMERPAFAASATSPDAIATRFGVFRLNAPGQPMIPRNYGSGPTFASVHLHVGRTFHIGGETKGSDKDRRKYSLTVSSEIQNLFNHTNPAPPAGNLSSPLFGQFYSSAGDWGSGTNSSGNRRIEAQIYFSF